jgi:rubrerythrin
MPQDIKATIKADLSKSMREETKAADNYRLRAEFAESVGDIETAKLYRRIADEHDKHYQEFEQRQNGVVIQQKRVVARKPNRPRRKIHRPSTSILR